MAPDLVKYLDNILDRSSKAEVNEFKKIMGKWASNHASQTTRELVTENEKLKKRNEELEIENKEVIKKLKNFNMLFD